MKQVISSEAEKKAAISLIASIKQVDPGTSQEKSMMALVASVAEYVGARDKQGLGVS